MLVAAIIIGAVVGAQNHGAGLGAAIARGALAFLGCTGVPIFFWALAQIVEHTAKTAHYAKLTTMNTQQLREINGKHAASVRKTAEIAAAQAPQPGRNE